MRRVSERKTNGKYFKAYNIGADCYIPEFIDITRFMKVECSIPHFQVTVAMTSAA